MVLSQIKEDGKEHVIAYASKSLNNAEKNYSVTEQECLAVVWAIRHFQHYLGLKPFEVITDHSALKWLQTAKMPTGRRARWIMDLQQYDFTIKHRAGKLNANADALSRIELEFSCFLLGVEHPAKKRRRLSESSVGRMQVTTETSQSEEELSEAELDQERTLFLIGPNQRPIGKISPTIKTPPAKVNLTKPRDFRDIGPAPGESESDHYDYEADYGTSDESDSDDEEVAQENEAYYSEKHAEEIISLLRRNYLRTRT